MNDCEINTSESKIEESDGKIEAIKKLVSSEDISPAKRLLWIQAVINGPLGANDESYEDRIKSKRERNMVIDYKNQEQVKELGFRINKEYGRAFVSVNGDYHGVIFRNFPTITTDDTDFTNCIFENTQAIEFSQANVKDCTFRNVSGISGHFTDFSGCTFVQCCSQGPLLTIDSGGSVAGCIFETITALGEGGYIIYSVYENKNEVRQIKNCQFLDCKAESADGLFTYCAYYVRCSTYKIKEIENVDLFSCDFGEGKPILIGNFETAIEDYDQ